MYADIFLKEKCENKWSVENANRLMGSALCGIYAILTADTRYLLAEQCSFRMKNDGTLE